MTLTSKSILYMEDVFVVFDGFKALDALNFSMDRGSCAASSARTARARPRSWTS